jgi:voltage-gated potassium channel
MRLRAATDTLKEVAAAYVVLILASAAAFSHLEGHSFLDSLYWAGTTATSTGYGDLLPKTEAGKWLALALMHTSIFLIAPLVVVRLIDHLNCERERFTAEEQERLFATLARIEARLDAIDTSRP